MEALTHQSPDPLDIPAFLRREKSADAPPARRYVPTRKYIMPPRALGAVARAVKTGADTGRKIRRRLRNKFSEAEIATAIRTLVESGEIDREGRRYSRGR